MTCQAGTIHEQIEINVERLQTLFTHAPDLVIIAKQLQQKFERLIRKLQNAKIDPTGFGMYARAYAYPQWLKVSDNWGEAFKDAEVNVKVNVKIIGMGAVK
ncbi:Ger(x)C family spore germination C-terminal domain-containing protein [Paenibacillus sp. MER TA 81-3]|uniref:Ger(x)C family spore germination C-terminal domain-containing protein n=1 Tax=Paenibacillus sp. MER TA 81-3 TaxID=2939573 RepID=UPI002040ADD7|nr:Ger(x)C family spore germination C-terminal domain-containing protein [Paenibacillus sp. MER TA 81-3]MCM3339784.1 Ger(x)C family spore germination C-terminal domain-containing protein [Paenibacillus sp. MER TA 81-3]